LDSKKEIITLITDQIRINKYQLIVEEWLDPKINIDIKAAARPIGRNTINEPSINSKSKKITAKINQT
tara:strand:- start:208 stop:411 length:204 start_codon:yes stop_codon:yes gene_type:complete